MRYIRYFEANYNKLVHIHFTGNNVVLLAIMPHLVIFMANYMENVPVTSGTTQSVNMPRIHNNSLTNTRLI